MKSFIFILFIIFNTGCVRYIEKTSEPMSQAAYAISDSIDKGRFDKADLYSKELIKLVPPPKEKIIIKSIYK